MDTFDIECRKCGTEAHVRIPSNRSLKPFTCPGCGHRVVIDAMMAGEKPQHDASVTPMPQRGEQTPSPQHETRNY